VLALPAAILWRVTIPNPKPRVLVTREDPAPLAEAVALAGGEPIPLQLLATRWLPFELPGGTTLEDYDWVTFTSMRAVEAVVRESERRRWSWPPQSRCAAVGDRTAHELQALGWMPECVAEDGTARGLLACLSAQGVFGARVLFPCSAIAEPTLSEGLTRAGARVEVLHVYTTVTAWAEAPEKLPFLARDLKAALDQGCTVTVASPSAVRALVDLAAAAGSLDALRRSPVAALGPTTGAAARAVGLRCSEANGRSLACLARKAVEIGL
jgi:uroporphyrinogen-III synthase